MKKNTALMALESLKLTVNQLVLWMRTGSAHMVSTFDHDALRQGRAAIAALEAEIAQPVELPSLAIITALRFYANGDHLNLDEEEDFDTVSGEPENWLCSGAENSATMVEDGSIARRALQGKLILWNDGDEDNTPKPIDGEVLYTEPKEPAVNAELLAALVHIQQVACSSSPELGIATDAIAKATGGAA